MDMSAIRQHGVLLAMAIMVAVSLIVIFHAPPIPVILGCAGALVFKAIITARHSRHP